MPNPRAKDDRFYIRVDADFWDHPKAIAAGPDGRSLYLCALAWSRKQLTDGAVQAVVLPSLAFKTGLPIEAAQTAADRLVEVGMWERTADGWEIHDYAEHQITRADVDRQRAQWRKRQSDKRARDQEQQDDHAHVTRDSRVSHAGVTPPESESESESESEEPISLLVPLTGTPFGSETDGSIRTATTDQRITATFDAWLNQQAANQGIPEGKRRQGYIQQAQRTIDQHWAALKALAKANPAATPDELACLYRRKP